MGTQEKESKESLKKRYDFIQKVTPQAIKKMSDSEWKTVQEKHGFTLNRDQLISAVLIFKKLTFDQFVDVAQNDGVPAVKLSPAEMEVIHGGWRFNLYALTCFGNYGHIDQDGIHISI